MFYIFLTVFKTYSLVYVCLDLVVVKAIIQPYNSSPVCVEYRSDSLPKSGAKIVSGEFLLHPGADPHGLLSQSDALKEWAQCWLLGGVSP